uniref:PHD-type domain-containing protein n=1 Tax=Peronospora matthiolae TaxID=2874970 RepID=A0AAV1TX87_9STRA
MSGGPAASRAVIPPMLTQENRDALVYTPQCHQRWGERQGEDATSRIKKAEVVDKFLLKFAWLNETEVALQCLFESDFDLPRAVELLHAARYKRRKVQRNQTEKLDPESFKAALDMYGKKFHLVKQALGNQVTTREIVSNYYSWKLTPEFEKWRRRQRPTRKCREKRKETKRLRLNGESDEDPVAETFQDYHDKKCGLCATGGKLLRCDGCTRAYHFGCIQSPITKTRPSDDEWFCPYCQEAFGGTKPEMMPSEENEYCLVCLPFPGVPQTLNEAMTDSSSEGEVDKAEGSSDVDASLRSNDEEISKLNVRTSALLRPEELVAKTADPGNLPTIKSDPSAKKFPSSLHGADVIEHGDSEHMPTSVKEPSAPIQPSAPAGQSRVGSSQAAPNRLLERFVEVPGGRARLQVERPIPGRRRHRKMLVPRRIPPSRLDN